LAKYGDVNDFEVKVASLLKDKKLRNQMAINALKWAKLFNWDAGKKKSIDLFNNRVHKDLHSTISNKFVHA
jgi:glycosyltransferase involved in cell wall biosynthesis